MVEIGESVTTEQASTTTYTLGQPGEAYKIVWLWGGESNTYFRFTDPNNSFMFEITSGQPCIDTEGQAGSGPLTVPGDTEISDSNANDWWVLTAVRIA